MRAIYCIHDLAQCWPDLGIATSAKNKKTMVKNRFGYRQEAVGEPRHTSQGCETWNCLIREVGSENAQKGAGNADLLQLRHGQKQFRSGEIQIVF